jgi:hypothetical protein
VGSAAALPCLLVTTATKSHGRRSQIARKAETLFLNADDLIRRVGIERIGIFTRTFADNVTSRKVAETMNHSWKSGYGSKLFAESISVPERQERGAFHYHDLGDVGCDIRTGFDFESCQAASALKKSHVHKRSGRWVWDSPQQEAEFKRLERAYFASANSNLKRLWREIGNSKHPGKAQEYGFGRCELLPILSNAQACARYIGSYVNIQHNRREDEDKGMRTVRYALKTVPVFCDGRWQRASVRPAIAQWAFVKGGAALWRQGCRTLSVLLGSVPDFTPVFGKRWAYMLAPFIFQCADHAEELLIDAAAIPPALTWLRRCRLVLALLNRYEFKAQNTIDLQRAEDHFLTSTPVHLPDFGL